MPWKYAALKESGDRSEELLGMKSHDIDFERGLLAINYPEKGSKPRTIKVSLKLLKMPGRLSRKSDRVFPTIYGSIYQCFMKQRDKASDKLANPRLKKLGFRRLWDCRLTMEAHRVDGNMLKV